MEQLKQQSSDETFSLHGGECTLVPREDFEVLLRKMVDLQGYSSLQTNCYQLDEDLIRMFIKYRTSVGISIDGNGPLNSLRGFPRNRKVNRNYTNQVINNISRLRQAGISVGILTILSKVNAGSNCKLMALLRFILMLRNHGVKDGRLNFMWSNLPDVRKIELTPEEASQAWIYLYQHMKEYDDLHWQPFREFSDSLLGFGNSSCSYGQCDYFCTQTKLILPDGIVANCDRTHQEDSFYTRAQLSYERYDILKQTDCYHCRFWDVCYGGCPAEGAEGDWRNKTRWCKPIYDLYLQIENQLKSTFPNVKLMSHYAGSEDYFHTFSQGIKNDPFRCMSWKTAKNPSSWKAVQLYDQQERQNQTSIVPLPSDHNKITN